MTKADIENVRVALKKLTGAVSPTGSKVEILLDRLATALRSLAETAPATGGLEDILACLDVDRDVMRKLDDIYEELQGVLESRSYGDEDDDDEEETLEYLLEDFADCLSGQLDTWEDECEE